MLTIQEQSDSRAVHQHLCNLKCPKVQHLHEQVVFSRVQKGQSCAHHLLLLSFVLLTGFFPTLKFFSKKSMAGISSNDLIVFSFRVFVGDNNQV
jgi:hypothetical protein